MGDDVVDVEVRGDGIPTFVYQLDTPSFQRVEFGFCGNETCTNFAGRPLASFSRTLQFGTDFSLEYNSSGHPVIALHVENLGLVVHTCNDPICEFLDDSNFDVDVSHPETGRQSSLALSPAGLPAIAYIDQSDNLKLAVCTDATCSKAPIIRTLSSGQSVYGPSLAFDGGRPVVAAAISEPGPGIALWQCVDGSCSDDAYLLVDGPFDAAPGGPSLDISAGEGISIGYFESDSDEVRLLQFDASAPNDVDCDGRFEAGDALIILRAISGLATNAEATGPCDLDVNNDESVDLADVLWMRRAATNVLP